ncbi:MAG: 23S rRNA (uracil(1939)-C(5))-methyltransferase RlmD [Burkholderiales bacterium]
MASAVARIESLDQDGRGVTHVDGKVFFVDGALPGETVCLESYRRKPAYELAVVRRVLAPSSARTAPRCPSFGVCGGCSMQHIEPRTQLAAKQRVLEDNLARIGKVRPETMLAPIHGPSWAYRYRARFSARFVASKGGSLIGFRERRRSFVTDMRSCEVVPPRISALLVPLRETVGALTIRERLPQIELSIGEGVDVLTFRVLEPLASADEILLREFGDKHRVAIYLQPGGPDTAAPFHPQIPADLHYTLPEFGLVFRFRPTDFTQVNFVMNRVLVRRAIALLDPQPGERIADLFCGLGNFSLALARRGACVLGIDGGAELLSRAADNATLNGLDNLCEFRTADLFRMSPDQWRQLGPFDKLLIDPPRDGAVELAKSIGAGAPRRIVYVSCNPATLARDAALLVNMNGYRLAAAGVINMFPHTSHVESIALFET